MELLIVEDDDAMASALAAAVVTAGHNPTRVARGADALLVHRKFGVVLLDLGLPDMDGLEVLRKLRQVTAVPILILTARDDERSVVLGLRSGADDYLVKPVKLVELVGIVERLLLAHCHPRRRGVAPDGHRVRPSGFAGRPRGFGGDPGTDPGRPVGRRFRRVLPRS